MSETNFVYRLPSHYFEKQFNFFDPKIGCSRIHENFPNIGQTGGVGGLIDFIKKMWDYETCQYLLKIMFMIHHKYEFVKHFRLIESLII